MILNTGALVSEAILIYLIPSQICITHNRVATIRHLLLKTCNKQ